ncbi:MAG: 3-deoxy-manno-octulosonate cytidylyltransferase [Leadbetterella sp.]
MLKILGIIPARFASSRFPGKLLHEVNGKPIIQMVYEQVVQSTSLESVFVATDHEKIFNLIESIGGNVLMTKDTHTSGTERCAEAVAAFGGSKNFDFVLNIQGDEPLILPETIDDLAYKLTPNIQIASLYQKINETDEILNPNSVKVVLNETSEALYFSRSPIPFVRDLDVDAWKSHLEFRKHIGIYGYRTDILEQIVHLENTSLEDAEKLEQLRWLSHGYKIKMFPTQHKTIGVDTPEDLENLKQFLAHK